METWKVLGKEQGGFRVASPHTARAVFRIIPPLNYSRLGVMSTELFALCRACSAGALGWQEAVCLSYLSAGFPVVVSVSLLAMPASQQLEQDEIASAVYLRRLPVSAEK